MFSYIAVAVRWLTVFIVYVMSDFRAGDRYSILTSFRLLSVIQWQFNIFTESINKFFNSSSSCPCFLPFPVPLWWPCRIQRSSVLLRMRPLSGSRDSTHVLYSPGYNVVTYKCNHVAYFDESQFFRCLLMDRLC